jgi:hypothetical protein
MCYLVLHLSPPPRPQDWDAFLRMCFSGKNKMLRSIFGNKNAPVTIDAGAAAADSSTATAGATDLLSAAAAAANAGSSPAVDASPAAAVPAAESAADDTTVTATDSAPSPRSRLVALLVEAGVAEMRPNGLSLPDFLRTYRLLRVAGQAVAATNATD